MEETQATKRKREGCDDSAAAAAPPGAGRGSSGRGSGFTGLGRGSSGRGCGSSGRGMSGRGHALSGRGQASVEASGKKTKKQKKKEEQLPKLDPKDMTAKQLKKMRARGKWRKNKKEQQEQKKGVEEINGAEEGTGAKESRKSRKRAQAEQHQGASTSNDPSQLYISNPKSAPRVIQAAALFKSIAIPFPVSLGPTTGWRTHSKLAVRNDSSGHLTIGLFEPNSHEIVDAASSLAHHKSINKTVKALVPLCKSSHVPAYSEKDGSGTLKYVVLTVERQTGNIQLTLVVNEDVGEPSSCIDTLSKSIVKSKDIPLHSLFLHFNKAWKHANNIFSFAENSWKLLHGPEALMDIPSKEVGCPYEVGLNFPPNVFRQANLTAFTGIIKSVREYLEKRGCKKCVELYGGVGTLGFHFVDLLEGLVCSDENPNNQVAFDKTRKGLEKSLRAKIERYVQMGAEAMVTSGRLGAEDVDVVVVDPPRKGLDKVVVDEINARRNIKTLVYVSCGFNAFQNDCEALRAAGGWEVVKAGGWILFPGSDHIETLAIFERSCNAKQHSLAAPAKDARSLKPVQACAKEAVSSKPEQACVKEMWCVREGCNKLAHKSRKDNFCSGSCLKKQKEQDAAR